MNNPTYIHGTDTAEQERLARLNRLTNPAFLEFLEVEPDSLVLEVGSGLGILAEEVARRFPQGSVWGLERSAAQLSALKNRPPNLRFVQGDAHRLPFEEGRFDTAYCRYVLEHVASPVKVLMEIRRVLKAGGRIFVQENNILVHALDPDCPRFDALWRKFARLQERLGGDAAVGKKLYALLKKAGFQELELSLGPEVHRSGQPGFSMWLENLIGNLRSGERELRRRKLAGAAEIDRAVAEVRALLARDDASAIFYWNRAKARKI
ncbi:MAG: methyltransferase domain-containing protein [Planctomycetes bacterium]|nr:methyltransferase domain-containing protein [Planctomycetota bacterium]